MLRTASFASFLLLSACGGETRTERPAGNAAAEEAKPAAEVPSLAGGWIVTKLEGRDASGMGMMAQFDAGEATLSNGCIRRAWTYTQDRNIVSFKANPAGSSNCGGSTPGAGAETAYAALERANIAIFAREGKEVSLSGTGGNLTLERR